jgi:hypothetical protein
VLAGGHPAAVANPQVFDRTDAIDRRK